MVSAVALCSGAPTPQPNTGAHAGSRDVIFLDYRVGSKRPGPLLAPVPSFFKRNGQDDLVVADAQSVSLRTRKANEKRGL